MTEIDFGQISACQRYKLMASLNRFAIDGKDNETRSTPIDEI